MDEDSVTNAALGVPEFTELGKRIEMLRIERGLSKQGLARSAGTSRQQLWRVMTGKSELTLTLRMRLADVLQVSALELLPTSLWSVSGASSPTRSTTMHAAAVDDPMPAPVDIHAYLGDHAAIARTLGTVPGDRAGRRLKRRILDAIEDVALDTGVALDAAVFDLRRRVLSGEL